jgi:hypothetical protein
VRDRSRDVGIVSAQIGQHHALTGADAPGDWTTYFLLRMASFKVQFAPEAVKLE